MIIFLYGADTFRSRRKLRELKEKFVREVDPTGHNMVLLDGEKADLAKLSSSITSVSLLAKKRMVVIEKLLANKTDAHIEQFLAILGKHRSEDDTNIIVFWEEVATGGKLNKAKTEAFKFLAKQKYAQEFRPMSNTELANWIKKEVEGQGGQISFAAAGELAALTGSDPWQIEQEINKLVSYKAGQQLGLENAGVVKIEIEDVRELVAGAFDEKIFALTDAISLRQRANAAKLLEEQLKAGLAPEYILSMILRQFRILVAVRQAMDTGANQRQVATNLKLHPFVAGKALKQAAGFNLASLKSIIERLLKIDFQNKTGQGDVITSLNLLFAKL